MAEEILQCCYTNMSQRTDGKLSSGWQTVAVSEHIPARAYKNCAKYQKINSMIQGNVIDEHGRIPNLLEICGDGEYLYVIRTQYGLVDRLGRANLFSHAYILSWGDKEVLADPNAYLTLDNENFTDNLEDASKLRENLTRIPKFTLEGALEEAGLDKERYQLLVWCVYAQMSERRITEPLYIQYDGNEHQMRAILYCIYCGIPYYMRKYLCVASTAIDSMCDKNIVFSERAEQHRYYMIPGTGENNVLTERIGQKIERYGFIDHAVKNMETADDVARYFVSLEEMAAELGDPSASDELILKIADQFLQMERYKTEELSDTELGERLSDALRTVSSGNTLMDTYIAVLLKEACRRGYRLTEENERDLERHLADTRLSKLKEMGERYPLDCLCNMPLLDAVKKLEQMSKDSRMRYMHGLLEMEKGMEILDAYYAEKLLKECPASWEEAERLWKESAYINSRPLTEAAAAEQAWKLYCSSLDSTYGISASYTQYRELIGKIVGPDQTETYEKRAKEEYWEQLSFDRFIFTDPAEYELLKCYTERCRMFLDLSDLVNEFDENKEEAFLCALQSYFQYYGQAADRDEFRSAVKGSCKALEKSCEIKDRNLREWMELAVSAESQNVYADIMRIRKYLYRHSFGKLQEVYMKFIFAGEWQLERDQIVTSVNKMISEVLDHSDRIEELEEEFISQIEEYWKKRRREGMQENRLFLLCTKKLRKLLKRKKKE